MGQHCSCLEHTHKYQRRQSDELGTADMERGGGDNDDDGDDSDDGDDAGDDEQELELLGGCDHTEKNREMPRSRSKTDSSGRSSQCGLLRRVGSTRTSGLVLDGDEDEVDSEVPHLRRECGVEWIHWDADSHAMPFSRPGELQRLLHSYQEATGVIDEGQLELECIVCLGTFSVDDPKVRTLCMCGMNRTNFHMSCLLEWLNRDANCPVCREYLYFEDS
ncbi:unnamed protein product [Hyaloperonospora brassicae]|uniref:RING-type domain-containing protein n=1 Tax=Hyaloperonospora brassicae TaxID=162125 RepID=A0AAV0T5P4_HYABA|nr:unnamed protein product [Hyaloperonospora brassicae]